jgi:hypothetical protein
MFIRNPAMPSDEPSNRQSVNIGLLNPTTPALSDVTGLSVADVCKTFKQVNNHKVFPDG